MAENFFKHNIVMLVSQGFAVFSPLSILLHKFTIILCTDTSLFIIDTMGTIPSVHIIEVSVLKRTTANADIFLDMMSHSPLVSWATGECNTNSSEFNFCCFPTTPWVYQNTAELKWFHILKSSSTTPSPQ